MLYDYIRESILLENEELLEDRMVKYNGELAPKFGWCVIYVGGPASGKGTATSFLSRLEGDYFNVDNLKEIERMWKNIIDPKTGRPHADNLETPSEIVPKLDAEGNQIKDKNGNPVYYDKYRNMSNSDFVSELHSEMKPLSKKWKRSMLYNPENLKGRDRLPNLIFDITGDELRKIAEIMHPLKEIGYNIAIIWMLTTPEKAILNNFKRERSVDVKGVLLPKHKQVINSIEELFSSNEVECVDEFWVIDTSIDIDPKKDPVGYHDAQNVYHIPVVKDGLKTIEYIADKIAESKSQFSTYGV